MEDGHLLGETLQAFEKDQAACENEHLLGWELKNAIDEQDYQKVLDVTKKPVFNFLDLEVTKAIRQYCKEMALQVEV
jgi:hypothetical protein